MTIYTEKVWQEASRHNPGCEWSSRLFFTRASRAIVGLPHHHRYTAITRVLRRVIQFYPPLTPIARSLSSSTLTLLTFNDLPWPSTHQYLRLFICPISLPFASAPFHSFINFSTLSQINNGRPLITSSYQYCTNLKIIIWPFLLCKIAVSVINASQNSPMTKCFMLTRLLSHVKVHSITWKPSQYVKGVIRA